MLILTSFNCDWSTRKNFNRICQKSEDPVCPYKIKWTSREVISLFLYLSYVDLATDLVWPVLISDHQPWWMQNFDTDRIFAWRLQSTLQKFCSSPVWSFDQHCQQYIRNSNVFHRGFRGSIWFLWYQKFGYYGIICLFVWDSSSVDIFVADKCWTVFLIPDKSSLVRRWIVCWTLFLSRCYKLSV